MLRNLDLVSTPAWRKNWNVEMLAQTGKNADNISRCQKKYPLLQFECRKWENHTNFITDWNLFCVWTLTRISTKRCSHCKTTKHCKTFSDSEGSRLEEDFASTTLQTRPKVFYLLLLLFFVFLHFKFQYFIGESPWGRLQLNNSPNHTKGFSKQVSSSFGLS